MEELILEAMDREEGKFREIGSVPGVLYGDGIEKSISVKFNLKELTAIINKHGKSAKVWVNLNNNKRYGFIKEVQRKHLTREVSHIDVQFVNVNHEIKRDIPITFNGEDSLNIIQLQLNIYKPEITVTAKMALIPDSIQIDVSKMQAGDEITISNFTLDEQLKVENEEVVYASVNHMKAIVEEEEVVAEEASTEPVAE